MPRGRALAEPNGTSRIDVVVNGCNDREGFPMARKSIITVATDTMAGATEGAASLAAGAAHTVAKAATGTALKAVRGARRLVAVPKKRRKVKRKAVSRGAGRKTKAARSRTARSRTARAKPTPRKSARKVGRVVTRAAAPRKKP
jgi:hypothetical protein